MRMYKGKQVQRGGENITEKINNKMQLNQDKDKASTTQGAFSHLNDRN